MNNYDAIEIVKASNMSEDAMLYILSMVSAYNNRRQECDREIREKILASMPINEPIRIKEICAKSFPQFSIQKITSQMRRLVVCGAVNREEINTGRTIKVTRKKWVWDWDSPRRWNGHWENEEIEIEERIAVFTRRY